MSQKVKKICIAVFLVALGGIGVGFYIYYDLIAGQSNGYADLKDAVPDLERMIIADSIQGEERAEIEKRIRQLSAELSLNSDLQSSWIELGNWRKEAGDYDGAQEVSEYMILRWPNNKVGFENLGALYHFYLHDYVQAEKYFKLAIEKEPSYLNGYINLYDLYTMSLIEKKDEAKTTLIKGLENIPQNVSLLYLLAQYYLSVGDESAARENYNKVLQLAETAGDANTVKKVQDILHEI
jgi:tetratricopeptide (TPR) repeat protein